MLDLFYLSIAVLCVTIVVFIARAVRLTREKIDRAGREIPLSRSDVVARVLDRMRSLDVRCERCGQPTFAMLDTQSRYKCESETCRFEFEGPPHVSGDAI